MNKPEIPAGRNQAFLQMTKEITDSDVFTMQSQNNYFCQTDFKFYTFTDWAISASNTRGNY
jgi:hypothetical protein